MVRLIDLENPDVAYTGRIFWDMLRAGVRLVVMGPNGCVTSVVQQITPRGENEYLIETRNSRYLLSTIPTSARAAPELMGALSSVSV